MVMVMVRVKVRIRVRVKVRAPRRGSVRVRTPSRGRLSPGGGFSVGCVSGGSCLQGRYLLQGGPN